MKIQIGKKQLLEGINKSSRGVTGRTTNSMLDGILLEAVGSELTLIGSDSNLTVTTKLREVNISEDGNIIVDAKILSEILRKLPDLEITLETNESILTISCLKSIFNIGFLNGNDYPRSNIQGVDGDEILIEEDFIKDMVKGVSFAAALDDNRPILKGMFFEVKNRRLNIVALDGYRLARKSLDIDTEKEISAVLDARDVVEASKIMSAGDMVTIKISANHAVFSFGDTTVSTKLLQGQYVDYATLLPSSAAINVSLDRTELISSLERASLMSENGNRLVKMDINSNKMDITAKSTAGKVEDSISLESEGDVSLTIAFNAKYVLDALKVLNTNRIQLKMNRNIDPCILKGLGDTSSDYLVLPVRIA